MALDSVAVFKARVLKLGMNEDHFKVMEAKGWNTLGGFAFSSSYAPGQPNDAPFIEGVAKPIFGVADHQLVPALRRLFYEAYAIAAHDMRRKIETRTDDLPRTLPNEERHARYEKQARRLVGLDLTGEYECSTALVDKGVDMAERNRIKYTEWESCTCLEQELEEQKKMTAFVTDTAGFQRKTETSVELRADLTSDLKVKYALTRRGLMLDQANLIAFENHELLVKMLLKAYARKPPPGYARVSLEQLRQADRELFLLLAQSTRAGVAVLPDGSRPLDNVFKECLNSPDVQLRLLPLQAPGANKRGRSESSDRPRKKSKVSAAEKAARKAQSEKDKASSRAFQGRGFLPLGTGGSKGGGGKGGKSSKKASSGGAPMPKALIGMARDTTDGRAICFAFNIPGQGCSGASPGQRCPKGWHFCCVPGCSGPHCMQDHK